ncbi:MAG: hypothetical protein ACR2MS_01075 [Weeksellaceae bacterium]
MLFTTLSYAQYPANSGPTEDFDGDGVLNENDADDDNDGISDEVESFCEAYVTGFVASSVENVNFPERVQSAPDNRGARFTSSASTNSKMIVDFGEVLLQGTILYFEAVKEGTAVKTLYIQPAPNGDYTGLGVIGSIDVTNNQYNTVPDQTYTLTQDTRYLALSRDDTYTTTLYIDAILHQSGVNCSFTDEDLDNIPDKFDLDSDNDGCPDSLEGDGTQVLLSQLHLNATASDNFLNGMIKTAIDSNTGIPLIVGSGNGLGTSENPFEQSNECQYWCSDLSGPDTDGDGRGDECDVDDDNDGILDIDEGLDCRTYALFFQGQRSYTGAGDIRNAAVGGVMLLKGFLREVDANGNDIGGKQYDLQVVVDEIYQPSSVVFTQTVDFGNQSVNNNDVLVVFYGGSATSNPYVKLSMTLLDPDKGNIPRGLSDATIRFSDIDSNNGDNFTEIIGVLKDNQLTSSNTISTANLSEIEAGGFEYGSSLPVEVTSVNNDYALYRLKKDNGSWTNPGNVPEPNPTPEWTAGYKFDQLSTLKIVFGYTTTTTSPYTSTNLGRYLSFSKDDVQLCVFEDTDLDGIPNEEDLDTDGDGCPDAIEGNGPYTRNDIVTSSVPGGNDIAAAPSYNGTANYPVQDNLGIPVNSYGLPLKVNNTSDDISGNQNIGASQNININGCSCEKSSTANQVGETLIGISSARTGNDERVVSDYSNGFIALESRTLGLVPTRIDNPETVIGNTLAEGAVEGMVVWDNDDNCLKLYDGDKWKCARPSCDDVITYQ